MGIGNRHEFDHAAGRMAGQARRLVKILPAQKILPDALGQAFERLGQTLLAHDAGHILRA